MQEEQAQSGFGFKGTLVLFLMGALAIIVVPHMLNLPPLNIPAPSLAMPGQQVQPQAQYRGTGSSSTSHLILHAPTIGAGQLDAIFCRDHLSPLCGQGQNLYNDASAAGVDPIWLAAISVEESHLGETGEAPHSKSIGNMRCLDQANFGRFGTWCQDGYAWFPSWDASFKAACQLLAGPLYARGGYATIEKAIYRWAPWGDSNNPPHYAKVVLAAAALWRSGSSALPTHVV